MQDGTARHPGQVLLEDHLKPMGISQTELAKGIGVWFSRVNETINGRRGITPNMALRLEKFLGTPASQWLTLQYQWEVERLLSNPQKVAEYEQIMPVVRAD